MKNIIVFGGNGFLGRKICEISVKKGYNVTSVSRSGKKPTVGDGWTRKVKWEKADILNPKTYTHLLSKQDVVVHSIGLLFENTEYKKSLNSNISVLTEIQNLANSMTGANPMAKTNKNSYEALQRDSAVLLADSYINEHPKDPTYVYISADKLHAMVPSMYLITKREAEFELKCKKGLRAILMRPGIMYDKESNKVSLRDAFTSLLNTGYQIKSTLFGDKISLINDAIRPVVSTEQVAEKILQKVEDENFKGVVTLEEIIKS